MRNEEKHLIPFPARTGRGSGIPFGAAGKKTAALAAAVLTAVFAAGSVPASQDDAVWETEAEIPADVLEIKSDVTYRGADGRIDSVVKAEDTDPLSPARPGTFVEFPLCSSDDRTYHNVLLSVDGIWTQSEDAQFVDRIIEANNAYGGYCTIDRDAEMPDDVEFCVMKYTFMIPDDFPSRYYGIYELDPHFRIRTVAGTAVPSKNGKTSYNGLTKADHLMTEDRDGPYLPGGIYEQYALFEMVEGFRDYVFTVSAYRAGTNIEYPGHAEYVTACFSPFTEDGEVPDTDDAAHGAEETENGEEQ